MSLADIRRINPKSVLDVGANVGGFYQEAHALWPDAAYFLIEGNETCRPYLEALRQAHKVPFKIAYLGDSERDVQLYKRKGGGTDTGNSYYRELTPFFNDDQIEVENVKLIPLSSLNLPQWEFAKIDCQGAELDILRGGLEQFKKAKWILLEVSIESYNLGAPLWDEVVTFMNGIGFTERQEIGDIVHPIKRQVIVQKDVLFSKVKDV